MFSFRKDWRRTWVVRAAGCPEKRVVEHQDGFAVIQEYSQRQGNAGETRERWQPPRRSSADSMSDFPMLRSKDGAMKPQNAASVAAPRVAPSIPAASLVADSPMAVAALPASGEAPSGATTQAPAADLQDTIARVVAEQLALALEPLVAKVVAVEAQQGKVAVVVAAEQPPAEAPLRPAPPPRQSSHRGDAAPYTASCDFEVR